MNDVETEYMTFFAEKIISMIRAPDSYVCLAPFNLIEIVLVSLFECVYSLFVVPGLADIGIKTISPWWLCQGKPLPVMFEVFALSCYSLMELS